MSLHFTGGGRTTGLKSNHAEWQGRRGVQVKDYQQHTLYVEPYIIHHQSDSLFLPAAVWRALAPGVSPAWLAGRNRGCRFWREVLEGLWAGAPALLAARFSSEPHTHGRDEGSPLATTIFRQEEGHITLW